MLADDGYIIFNVVKSDNLQILGLVGFSDFMIKNDSPRKRLYLLNEKSETAGAGAKICVSGWARSSANEIFLKAV